MTPDNNNETSAEIAALKNQIFSLLIALIVLSGTFMVYLFRETTAAGKELAQGKQLMDSINRNDANIGDFVHKLMDYGDKNPDFKQKVLAKYGLTMSPTMPGGLPGAPKK